MDTEYAVRRTARLRPTTREAGVGGCREGVTLPLAAMRPSCSPRERPAPADGFSRKVLEQDAIAPAWSPQKIGLTREPSPQPAGVPLAPDRDMSRILESEELGASFGGLFPEPLQGVIHHAERLSVALSLLETDEGREMATGPRELSLSETWIVGRASEVEALVGDVVGDWRSGRVSTKTASVVIERYLMSLHHAMLLSTPYGGPTCCSSAQRTLTVDFFASHDHGRAPPPLVHIAERK